MTSFNISRHDEAHHIGFHIHACTTLECNEFFASAIIMCQLHQRARPSTWSNFPSMFVCWLPHKKSALMDVEHDVTTVAKSPITSDAMAVNCDERDILLFLAVAWCTFFFPFDDQLFQPPFTRTWAIGLVIFMRIMLDVILLLIDVSKIEIARRIISQANGMHYGLWSGDY